MESNQFAHGGQHPTIDNTKELSKTRMLLMKGLYLLTFLTLGHSAWSALLFPTEPWIPLEGVAFSFWAAYATIMGLGVRYPIKMLPLLLLQLFYKSVWLLWVAYPLWSAGEMNLSQSGLFRSFAIAIPIDLLVIPWRYVWRHFAKPLFRFKTSDKTSFRNL